MPIDKEKAAAYLRYRRTIGNITYARVTELSGVPGSTLSAYFNGNVQSPNQEIFSRLVGAVGGSWEEYDSWQPDGAPDPVRTSAKDVTDDMQIREIIESLQQSFEKNAMRLEATYNASVARLEAAHTRAERGHRAEKYVLFALLVLVSVYAVFAFTHYDLADPTTGLTGLFGGE